MKNRYLIIALTVAFILSTTPILTAEISGEQMPMRTLADFQKEYSGTKPIVAWNKYHEYLALQKAPKPTLEPSRMRFESNAPESARGTKDVVAFLKRGDENRQSLAETHPSMSEYKPASRVSGTKDIVAFTR